ncbi:MAG TPA: DUF433 domain-containing protein [Bryobacteraceae bacterium]|nr:DUF433 domain-containing protein [Bryobacteraceae bacterium]
MRIGGLDSGRKSNQLDRKLKPRPCDVIEASVSWKFMSGETKIRMSEIVSVDPRLMHGTPCFRGTRVPVHLLLDDLKAGFTIDDFLAGCPTVTREHAQRCLELAQDLVTECAVS